MTRNTSNSLISESTPEPDQKLWTSDNESVRREPASVEGTKRVSTKTQSTVATQSPRQEKVDAGVLDPDQDNWVKKSMMWLAGFSAMGYGFSLLLHSLVLVASTLTIWTHTSSNRLEINGQITEGIEDEISEIIDTRIDLPSKSQKEQTQLSVMPIPLREEKSDLKMNSIQKTIEQSIGKMEGDGDGGIIPEGGKKGKNAVTKGSFTAWTVPDDPKFGQMYWIVIEVKIPKGTRSYSSKDLTGYVVGTDGYTKPIGFFKGGQITPEGQFWPKKYYGRFNRKEKRLMIDIPPALEALVEDTIKVRSDLLNEEQTLKIVF